MVPMVMATMVVMPMAVVVTRSAHVRRTQLDIHDSGDRADAGLALQAQRLQRNRVIRTAHQQVGTDADTRRRVGADATEVTGERAAAEPMARRIDDPRQTGFRGGAQIESEALDARDIRFRRCAIAAAEHALHFGGRSDHVTDVRAAMAFEHAGLNLLLSLGARDGRNQRHRGHGEKFWEVHELISARELN